VVRAVLMLLIQPAAKLTNNARRVLTDDDVREAIAMHARGESQVAIADWLGVSRHTIGAMLRGITWRHVTGLAYDGPSPRPRGQSFRCARLAESDVLMVVSLSRNGMSQRSIAERFRVSRGCVDDILRGRSWSWLTGIGREAE
jgi:transposase